MLTARFGEAKKGCFQVCHAELISKSFWITSGVAFNASYGFFWPQNVHISRPKKSQKISPQKIFPAQKISPKFFPQNIFPPKNYFS